MSAHVLLNLLNEFGKRDNMGGLPSILSLFRSKFNKFNNTRAQMLDSVYHRTLKRLKKSLFGCENVKILPYFMQHSNTPRLYSQWLNSVICWLINHCTAWARTSMTSFGRQFKFHDVIYHKPHCNVDNRRHNVVFTTT